jgi:hypothetical protein
MSEAEVSLRLAFWLVRQKLVSEDDNDDNGVFVAIDNARFKAGQVVVFDVPRFLHENHWRKTDSAPGWLGTYRLHGAATRLVIGHGFGYGDLVCRLKDGRHLCVQAERGPLTTRINSEERRLTLEVLGRLLIVPRVLTRKDERLLAVAVPYSPRFTRFAERWREAPLIKSLGIHILTVGRDGDVDGLSRCELEQFRKHQGATTEQETLGQLVRSLLACGAPPDYEMVWPAEYPGYYAFAKRGNKKVRQWPPGSVRDYEIAHLVESWTEMGLNRKLLLLIAWNCFDHWIPPEDRPVIPSPGLGKIAVSREPSAIGRDQTRNASPNSGLPASPSVVPTGKDSQ